MAHRFRLYWRRIAGCDSGTPVDLEDLDAAIQPRVSELAGRDRGPIAIRLPFFDRREWRRRSESLRAMVLVREGRTIRYVPASAAAALRDAVAETAGGHPAWLAAPVDRERGYFRVWRNVSVALQEFLRRVAPEFYFRDPARYEDRRAAGALLVYQASRVCHGFPETEFTYDISKPETFREALHQIGPPMQKTLRLAQQQVESSGRSELARRYDPLWHEDFVREACCRPQRLLALLGDEAQLIEAVVTLGTARSLSAVRPFARSLLAVLRSFHDCDMRELTSPLLAEATRALERELDRTKKAAARRRRATLRLPPAASDRAFAAAGTSGRCRPGSAICR